jgi:hypothetical protein
MKRNYLKNLFKLAGMFIAALTLTFTACNNDDDGGDDPINLVEDGIYVRGAGTALIDLNTDGLMQVTKNEVVQGERSSLLELYVAVKGGTEGFNIVIVTGGEETVYGPSTDFSVVAEADRNTDEPQVDFWRGSYTESETQFTVLEDGLYHFVIDTELKKAVLAPVSWGLIGAATPGGWTDDTELTQGAFDLETITFSLSDVEMKLNEYKYRYSGGWKIILDTVVDLGEGNKGVNVNTNYGGSMDALVSGGKNINVTVPGIYTMSVTWSLDGGTTASAEKTGDLSFTDWSDVSFDVFGSGVDPAGTGAVVDASSWAWGYAVSADALPTVEGDVATGAMFTYTWTNVALVNADDEGFALRSVDGTEYNGNVLRYSVVDEALSDMTAIESTTNGFGDVNINAIADGGFDIVLEIDAGNNDAATAVIVKTGSSTYDMWAMIGSATPNGWNDPDTDLTPNGDGTEWTWTGDLVEGEFKFRANDSWDSQIGDDGAGGAEFSTDATAWVIAAGDVGNYTIVLDSETPDVTITKN